LKSGSASEDRKKSSRLPGAIWFPNSSRPPGSPMNRWSSPMMACNPSFATTRVKRACAAWSAPSPKWAAKWVKILSSFACRRASL